MSGGAYSPAKAACFPERIEALRRGEHVYPVHLHLIPSDFCQLSCPGCAYRLHGYSSNELFELDGGKNPKRFLPTRIILRVLDDCVRMGTTAIEITGGGEPTLHPDIVTVLAHAHRELGLHTALITNGLLLGRHDIAHWAAQGSWARVSVDAATSAVYDAVRPNLSGVGAKNLDRVLAGLSRLRAMRDEISSACAIGAGFVVQRENWRDVYAACSVFRSAGADNVRISGLFSPDGDDYFAGWREQAVELERRAVADFHRPTAGFSVYGRLAEKIADLQRRPDYSTCWYQRFTLYLGADANLYRCCVYAYNRRGLLGNVIEAGGLKALLDRPDVQQRLAGFDARGCERCQFNDRNREIARLIAEPAPGAPPADIQHADFV